MPTRSTLVPALGVLLAALAIPSEVLAFDLHADLVPASAASTARGTADCVVAESGLGGSPARRVVCTLRHTQLSGAPTSAGLFRTGTPVSTLALVPCNVASSPITCTGDVPATSVTYSDLQSERMSVGIATAAAPVSPGEVYGRLLRVVDGGAPDAGPGDAGPAAPDGGMDASVPVPPLPDAGGPVGDASLPTPNDASAPSPDAAVSPPGDGGGDGEDDGQGASCSAIPIDVSSQPAPVVAVALVAVGLAFARRRRPS